MSAGADELDPTRDARDASGHSDTGGEAVGSVLEVKVLNLVRRPAATLAPAKRPRGCRPGGLIRVLTVRGCNVGAQGTIPVPVQADDRVGTVKRMLADRHFVRSMLYSHTHFAARASA
jgi:hypothetical protein